MRAIPTASPLLRSVLPLAALLFLFAQPAATAPAAAGPDITLVVTVLDANGSPVSGAAVRVAPMGRNLQDGTTGRDGVVRFTVPSGTMRSIEVTNLRSDRRCGWILAGDHLVIRLSGQFNWPPNQMTD
jgi:hypothetical protein